MVLERVLVWLCGENYEVLRFHQRDKLPYLFIGFFIVASAGLAGAAAVALLQLLWSVPLAIWIPISLLAALVSMGLDRFLVAALLSRDADASQWVYVAVLSPRALLGVLSAICAATLVVMQFATVDFNRQIVAAQHQNSQAFYASLAKSKLATDISVEQEFVAALNAPDEIIKNLQVQLRIVQGQETYTLQNYYCLLGYGPCAPKGPDLSAAQQAKQVYDVEVNQAGQISSTLSALESKHTIAAAEAKLPAAESQLKSDRAAEATQVSSFQAGNNHPRILARLWAVVQATDRGWAGIVRWVLIALVSIVACLPLVLKRRLTRKPPTQYEMAMSERSNASTGRGVARAERREEGRRPMAWGSDAEAGTATVEEAYRLLAEWVRKIPATRDEVTAIGSRITNVLLRDWQRRR
jgi:hypothetical protein